MKGVLLIVLILHSLNVAGQKATYSCTLLKDIVSRIELERRNITMNEAISYKIYAVNGKIVKRKEYINDPILDSILKLPDINMIARTMHDSVFYLKENNLILDTFCFFSPECNFQFNGKNLYVLNDYSSIRKYQDYNLIILSSLNTYRTYSYLENRLVDYSTISLRHKSAKSKFDNVMFFYVTEENVPIVKEVRVMRKNQIDISEERAR